MIVMVYLWKLLSKIEQYFFSGLKVEALASRVSRAALLKMLARAGSPSKLINIRLEKKNYRIKKNRKTEEFEKPSRLLIK